MIGDRSLGPLVGAPLVGDPVPAGRPPVGGELAVQLFL